MVIKKTYIWQWRHSMNIWILLIISWSTNIWLSFFNTGALHWVMMVVVNLGCISTESIASGSDRKCEEPAGGWSFFDSCGMAKNQYKDGLKGTMGDTDINIISLVQCFMNVCASFINAINSCNQKWEVMITRNLLDITMTWRELPIFSALTLKVQQS